MLWFAKSKDHLPLTWWKGHPVYFAAVAALVGVGSMVVTAMLITAGVPVYSHLAFSCTGLIEAWRFWTPVSYALVNPPSIWVVLTSYFLWRFGEDVEKFFGRRVFVRMMLCFLFAEPALLTLLGLLFTPLRGWQAAGIFNIEFAVFIAFATLYPRAQISLIFCQVEAWLIASIFVAVSALQSMAGHNWPGLTLLLMQTILAFSLVRYEQGRWELPSLFGWFKRWRARRQSAAKLRVVRDGEDGDVSAHGVDAVLEKISRKGMQSLTARERKLLEKTSDDLKRDSRS